MKKLMFITLLLFVVGLSAEAQYSTKEVRKQLKMRPTREIKKEARKLEKNGFTTAVGALSIERQLTNAAMREIETDDTGYPKFIVASGVSVAESQIAAKLQATEAAKLELAGTLASNIASLIEQNIANQQLNTQEAASVTKIVAGSKNIIAQKLGRTITFTEFYRNVGKNIEANMRIAYNSDMAMEEAKNAIRKSLEEETEIVQEKLEKLMNF
jgi:hypothetical protein